MSSDKPPEQFKTWGNGKIVFELFPQEYIDLQIELMRDDHQKICDIVAQFGVDDIDMKLAQIASYCEVMLDGVYTLENRIELCKILKERLILLREKKVGQIILLN